MVMRFLSSRGEKEIAEFISIILKPFTSIEWGKIMNICCGSYYMWIRDRMSESRYMYRLYTKVKVAMIFINRGP